MSSSRALAMCWAATSASVAWVATRVDASLAGQGSRGCRGRSGRRRSRRGAGSCRRPRRSITGKGRFTLLTGFAGQAWVAAARKLDLPYLDAVVVGAPGSEDPYRSWDRLREVHDAGAILVRPDGFVAWRHLDAQWDDDEAQAALIEALTLILSAADHG